MIDRQHSHFAHAVILECLTMTNENDDITQSFGEDTLPSSVMPDRKALKKKNQKQTLISEFESSTCVWMCTSSCFKTHKFISNQFSTESSVTRGKKIKIRNCVYYSAWYWCREDFGSSTRVDNGEGLLLRQKPISQAPVSDSDSRKLRVGHM